MQNLKIIFQGEVCKTDKPLSLSLKTLKNMTPGKDEKWNIFFVDQSQILENICQQLLSLNNVFKREKYVNNRPVSDVIMHSNKMTGP